MKNQRKSLEKERTTIRIPSELKKLLQEEADEKGYTVNDLILFILWDNFQKPTVQE
ncbi:hypothetical protein [Dielma fastidiosa]|uniref:Uncharacterized protein n=1 Tax=Dielma fastidiosa TaxID=1034346 RepID=A0A318KW18_9FIRM|nr:hypothetical protein [Dielma fastidiosa]PXX77383.1 hypothetical protein DES51_111135 [Dielma fastidiosa]